MEPTNAPSPSSAQGVIDTNAAAGTPAPHASVDPFGLGQLLEKTALILKEANLDPAVEREFLKILTKDMFDLSRGRREVDPQALAQVMAQSPVISKLLDQRAAKSIVLAGSLQREDFNIVGAIYVYAKLVAQDKLLAADLTLWHAGEKGVDIVDVSNKLSSFYKRLAQEQHSPLRTLLRGEFDDTNVTAASSITAGLIAPIITLRHHLQQEKSSAGGFFKHALSTLGLKKVTSEVSDLGVVEKLHPDDEALLKELSEIRTKPVARVAPSYDHVAPASAVLPAPSLAQSVQPPRSVYQAPATAAPSASENVRPVRPVQNATPSGTLPGAERYAQRPSPGDLVVPSLRTVEPQKIDPPKEKAAAAAGPVSTPPAGELLNTHASPVKKPQEAGSLTGVKPKADQPAPSPGNIPTAKAASNSGVSEKEAATLPGAKKKENSQNSPGELLGIKKALPK